MANRIGEGASGKGEWMRRGGRAVGPGIAVAATLLMVLSPLSTGGIVHPNGLVMKAPFRGTATMVNSFPSLQGCYKDSGPGWVWSPLTGALNGSEKASAKVCPKSVGFVGAASGAYTYNYLYVAIPLRGVLTGNHSIGSAWTVQAARSQVYTPGGCPSKININYNPPFGTDTYGYCISYSAVILDQEAWVTDLQNGSWYSNFSEVQSYNETGWQNYTECYNYSGATCYNNTGLSPNNVGQYGYNAPGFATSFAWGSKSSYTMWTNTTNMVGTHRYVLIVAMFFEVFAEAGAYNVLGHWSGSAAASLNMATLGNGAKLNSVTIK